jgi:MFS family permease
MTSARVPSGPITDRDRRRACRQAHVFGAAAIIAVALLLFMVTRFRTHPVPVPVLIAAGSVLALAAGLAADLTARPRRVLLRGDWLAVSGLGHWQRVDTGWLTGLSANPRVAGSVVLADGHGHQAEVDVRVLVRNPLIWQQVCHGVRRARQRGSLYLPEEDALLWDSVSRMVAKADRQALTSIDFSPSH